MNLSKIILIAGLFIAQAGFSVKFHVMFIPDKNQGFKRCVDLDLRHAIEIECDDRTTFAQLNALLSGREKKDAPEWLRNAPEWVKEPKTVSSSPTGGDLLETPQRLVKDLFEANNVEASKVLFVKTKDALEICIQSAITQESNSILVKNSATFHDLAQVIKDIYYPNSDAPDIIILVKGQPFTKDSPSIEIAKILGKDRGIEFMNWIPSDFL